VISDQELHQAITELLETYQHPSADLEITDATPLADGGLELTSLDLIRLLVGLEEQFGIELEDTAVFDNAFDTVADLRTLVDAAGPSLAGSLAADSPASGSPTGS
jgi:acyl carrier protein